jgi:hypothetical protein
MHACEHASFLLSVDLSTLGEVMYYMTMIDAPSGSDAPTSCTAR